MAFTTMLGHELPKPPTGMRGFSVGRVASLVVIGIAIIVALSLMGNMVESVDRDEIMVIQAPLSGNLAWYTDGGTHLQWFGKVTKYPKRGIYHVETQVRFNDGGHGTLKGSIQYELPSDTANLTAIYTRFPTRDDLQKALIETVVVKSVYMTGPLMSSTESYAEKRNQLISNVEDQIENGVYRTTQKEVEVVDQLTGQKKSAIVVEVVMQNNQPVRQEQAVLKVFGIRTFNFSINALDYDAEVEKQIQTRQRIVMDVQTAIAEAQKAVQRKITIEQQGAANVAEAKFSQEVEKQKAVTTAEQALAVARLDNQSADQYKEATLKRADADATYRKRIMDADGALEKKLETYQAVQAQWAQAFQNFKGQLVPQVVTGGGQAGGNAALGFMDIIGMKAAKDLAADLTPGHVATGK